MFSTNSINSVEQTGNITEKSKQLVSFKKILSYQECEPWAKNSENKEFRVTIGSSDRAEVYELAGIYLLQ